MRDGSYKSFEKRSVTTLIRKPGNFLQKKYTK